MPATSTTITNRRLISAKQAAEHIGVKPDTIRVWAREGKISEWRLSQHISRYDADEIAAFIESTRQPAGSADRIGDHIAKVLESAPELTEEQKQRIVALLRKPVPDETR